LNGRWVMPEETSAKVLIISVAARMAGMHPQTLRQYDRMGLVSPGRTAGGGRRYSARDVALLREIQRLSQDDGVNLAGIKRIIETEQRLTELTQLVLDLQAELAAARRRVVELEAIAVYGQSNALVARSASGALAVWRPRRGADHPPATG
jgi:MerR family transcriptional regulator, heat shock protein HspR